MRFTSFCLVGYISWPISGGSSTRKLRAGGINADAYECLLNKEKTEGQVIKGEKRIISKVAASSSSSCPPPPPPSAASYAAKLIKICCTLFMHRRFSDLVFPGGPSLTHSAGLDIVSAAIIPSLKQLFESKFISATAGGGHVGGHPGPVDHGWNE